MRNTEPRPVRLSTTVLHTRKNVEITPYVLTGRRRNGQFIQRDQDIQIDHRKVKPTLYTHTQNNYNFSHCRFRPYDKLAVCNDQVHLSLRRNKQTKIESRFTLEDFIFYYKRLNCRVFFSVRCDLQHV